MFIIKIIWFVIFIFKFFNVKCCNLKNNYNNEKKYYFYKFLLFVFLLEKFVRGFD